MILFLVNLINSFLPAALVAGTVVALWWPRDGRSVIPAIGWLCAIGIVAGGIIYSVAETHGSVLESQMWLQLVNIVALVLVVVTALLYRAWSGLPSAIGFGGSLFAVAAVTCFAAYSFFFTMRDEAFSASSVLNTEYILNVASLMVGILVIFLLTAVVAHLNVMCGTTITLVFLVVVAGLNSFKWIAEAMLAMLRLDLIEVTTGRLSFVAKTTNLGYLFVYAQIGLVLLLAIVFFVKRPRLQVDLFTRLPKPEQRKARVKALVEVRWFRTAVACVLVMAISLLYYDLYASKPPTLSEATPVEADSDGLIKIKIDEVKDGNLYRYSYVTSDGTKVRFFLINRYQNSVKIGVVYDACMICGDMGYIQDGNEVICIACNVRMHIPSIGKPGGCNPIPFKHEIRDGVILIKTAELDRGGNYFHEKVEVEVQDPVTGKTLINLKAPHRYEYGGRTYFFESEESLKKFQEKPEDYVKKKEARFFRSQGWQPDE